MRYINPRFIIIIIIIKDTGYTPRPVPSLPAIFLPLQVGTIRSTGLLTKEKFVKLYAFLPVATHTLPHFTKQL